MYHFVLKLKILTLNKASRMDNIRQWIFKLLVALSLFACDNTEPTKTHSATVNSNTTIQEIALPLDGKENRQSHIEPEKKLPKAAFKTVEWTDLMPKEDLDALLNPPSYITDIEDGSIEDQISSQIQNALVAANDDRYQQALVSTRVVAEMDGQAIKIPGFIVPIEFDDEQTITQFFLVPFFGACIHVPPPPPNQIIFVDYPEGLKLEALYDPFWVSGVIKTSLIENELATATYSLTMQYFENYTE